MMALFGANTAVNTTVDTCTKGMSVIVLKNADMTADNTGKGTVDSNGSP